MTGLQYWQEKGFFSSPPSPDKLWCSCAYIQLTTHLHLVLRLRISTQTYDFLVQCLSTKITLHEITQGPFQFAVFWVVMNAASHVKLIFWMKMIPPSSRLMCQGCEISLVIPPHCKELAIQINRRGRGEYYNKMANFLNHNIAALKDQSLHSDPKKGHFPFYHF
jgi:hypothetical protein